jgi:hypothetical protein
MQTIKAAFHQLKRATETLSQMQPGVFSMTAVDLVVCSLAQHANAADLLQVQPFSPNLFTNYSNRDFPSAACLKIWH